MSRKRKIAYRAGIRAELIAVLYLMIKGYRVLAYRYKTPVGEIGFDVIAIAPWKWPRHQKDAFSQMVS